LRDLYPNAFHIGFTATPERLDGRGLAQDYDELHVVAQPQELIDQGFLVEPTIYTVPRDLLPDMTGTKKTRGEFVAAETEKRVNSRIIVGGIVEHWKRHANERRTLVFAVSIKHSLSIVGAFQNAGVDAAHLDGNTPVEDRAAVLERLASGTLRVISSCDIFSEGTDIPSVKCVIMARPTLSLALCIQQAGRCMRPWQKQSAVVLDHAGNIVRHGMPQTSREWSLDDARRCRVALSPVVCARCFSVNDSRVVCILCGNEHSSGSRELVPLELPGELAAVGDMPLDMRKTDYATIAAVANARGFGSNWVDKVYRAKYGTSTGL
jgi:superfamily II DNA or RNA helicase